MNNTAANISDPIFVTVFFIHDFLSFVIIWNTVYRFYTKFMKRILTPYFEYFYKQNILLIYILNIILLFYIIYINLFFIQYFDHLFNIYIFLFFVFFLFFMYYHIFFFFSFFF